jgi:RNA polymerase primary sigma factor
VRLPGDNASHLRSALREVHGDFEKLDKEMSKLHSLTKPASLDKQIGDEGDMTLGDLLQSDLSLPEVEMIANFEASEIVKLLDALNPRQRILVELRFGLNNEEPRSLRQLATEFGITPEGVRRGLQTAFKHMKTTSWKLQGHDN